LIYVPENIESFPIKLQHSSEPKTTFFAGDRNEIWEVLCHGVRVLSHCTPGNGRYLGFGSGQCQRFKIRNCDGDVSSSLLSHSQFSGVFEGRFANRNLHHFEFAGLLGKWIKPRC